MDGGCLVEVDVRLGEQLFRVDFFVRLFVHFYLPLNASKHRGGVLAVFTGTVGVVLDLLHFVFEEREKARVEIHV